MVLLCHLSYQRQVHSDGSLDYDLVKDKIPRKFLEKLLMFYTLSLEQKINVDSQVHEISDSKRHVKKFTARNFKLTEKKEVK